MPKERSDSTWHRLDDALKLTRADAVRGGVGVLFGGLVGWAVSEIASDPRNLQLYTVLALALIALVVCLVVATFLEAFQLEGRDRLQTVDQLVSDVLSRVESVESSVTANVSTVQRIVEEGVDASAILVPRESIYFEMAACIRNAKKQVVVLTTFMYDWENDRRTFNPVVQGETPGVQDFYDSIYKCIESPGVEYVRLWQVPAEHVNHARSKIEGDDRLRREIELIESIAPDNPYTCRMRIIPESTTASIILVDQETLFFNVDFFDSERKLWLSPFMLMIRDARGRAFHDMQRIITKLSTQI